MSLTDTAVRLAKPRDIAYRLSDARGLCLLIQPTGSKWWRFRYRFQGAEKMLSLGTYPNVSLSQARDRRDQARKTLEDGNDPSAERKETKVTRKNTFRVVAEHWLAGLARLGKEGHCPGSGPQLLSLREHSKLFDQFGGIWVQSGALTCKHFLCTVM
jgi:hypothetical protein